jgi:2'-hydroxyisoflavone reductase
VVSGCTGVVRFLVLGGTAWLGRHVATAALRVGHQVTCLARGESGSVPPDAVFVKGDRDQPGVLDMLAGEQRDVVIDVSRQPGQVRRAVAALTGHTRFYVFVSSGNVYADQSTPGQDEVATVLPALDGDVMESMATYGEAKVACERYVWGGFGPGRALIARVGLIGGPGDIFDRTGYWPLRFARPATPSGTVLVPDAPQEATQVIDVRDLANWLVLAGAAGAGGIFNVTGATVPLSQHLEIARAVAGHGGDLAVASPEWLRAHDVEPWMGARSLPLWIGDPDWAGFSARDSSKARAAGLSTRPLEETLADTLAWELTRAPVRSRQAGLSDEDERSLLHALQDT